MYNKTALISVKYDKNIFTCTLEVPVLNHKQVKKLDSEKEVLMYLKVLEIVLRDMPLELEAQYDFCEETTKKLDIFTKSNQ